MLILHFSDFLLDPLVIHFNCAKNTFASEKASFLQHEHYPTPLSMVPSTDYLNFYHSHSTEQEIK